MKVVITGGAGFIGCNAASRHLRRGSKVVVVDDLSRAGSERNLAWLRPQGRLAFSKTDIRDARRVREAFWKHRDAGLVLHLAGQVAVTTSVQDPRSDFESNALGTFNVLEGVRRAKIRAPFLYSSTNKVYGGMENLRVVERKGRYAYADQPHGIGEDRGLDFHSPYGCSKGAADQYVRDYHRIYGLDTVVFRQSCIYGARQFGVEDQGWVAWFMIARRLGRPLSIYGDGKQARDVLFVEDLLDAFDLAARRIKRTAGQVYNIGGGPRNVLSPGALKDYLARREGRPVACRRGPWRPGDQRVYISDIRKAFRDFGWRPKTSAERGLTSLYDWVAANQGLFR